jgi:hypothetical protein
MILALKDEIVLSLLYVPYNVPLSKVPDALYRELQACKILSVHTCDGVAVVEIEDCEKISTPLDTSQLAHIRVDYVNHHSALLPGWLSLKSGMCNFTIIHMDTHNDLGRPNLLRHGDQLFDRWTGNIVHPDKMSTVCQAIDSTAIEIGNYLTMALYWLPVTRLIWVCPENSRGVVRSMVNPRGLRLLWSHSDPLDTSVERLDVHPIADDPYDIAIQIVKTPDSLRKIIQNEQVTNIILDIDLDYFDNSFENSNNGDQFERLDPSVSAEWVETQRLQLDRFLDTLPFEFIISIGIACSPGFCPASKAQVLKRMVQNSLLARSRND